MRRRVAAIVAGTLVLLVALALLAHTQWVRGALLRYAVGAARQQFGVNLEASRLDYSLATLRFGLADVRVSMDGRQPFFEAAYLSVRVPPRVLAGQIWIDELEVRSGIVRVIRAADGTSNLPEGGDTSGEPTPLPIGRIALLPVRFEFFDEGTQVALVLPATEVELTATAGRIALTTPGSIRVGERTTRVTRALGGARFDGRVLSLDRLDVEVDEGRLRLDGSVTVIASEPSIDLGVAGSADIRALAMWGMAEADAPQGTVAFAGRVRGPVATPVAELQVDSDRVDLEGLRLSDLSARVRVSAESLEVTDAVATIRGGQVYGQVSLPLTEGAQPLLYRLMLTGGVRLENGPTEFVPLALPGESSLSVANGNWVLTGRHRLAGALARIEMRGRLSEDLMASTLAGTVKIAGLDIASLLDTLRRARLVDLPPAAIPRGAAAADVRLAGTFARINASFTASSERLDLDLPRASGPATVAGTYNSATTGYSITATFAPWQVVPSDEVPLSGMFAGTMQATGRGADAILNGDVQATGVTWQGTRLGNVSATVGLAEDRARIHADVPEFAAVLEAVIATTGNYESTIDLRAERVDLARVVSDLDVPLPVTGQVSLHAEAAGPLARWRDGIGRVEVTSFDATAGDLPVRLVEPAVVRYAGERVWLDRLEATAGGTHLSAAGAIAAFGDGGAETIVATITGDIDDVVRALTAAGIREMPAVGGTGPVALLARVAGSLEHPDLAADLELGPATVAPEGYPRLSGLYVRTHVEDGWLELREARTVYQGAAVDATGRLPLALLGITALGTRDGEATLRARATGVTAAVLEPFVDPETARELTGSLDVTLSLDSASLDVASVRGELQIDRLDIRVADLPVTQRTPTRLVARDGFLRVEAWDWIGEGASLGVSGQMRLADRQGAILANGEIDLRMLTPFVADAGLAAAGTMRPRLSITGDLTNPRFDGDLLVEGAELRLDDPRVVVTDLNGRAVLTRSSATITAMTGSINGGTVEVGGRTELVGDTRLDTVLTTAIRGMALEFPDGLRSEVNADLELVMTATTGEEATEGRLSGAVTVTRGAFREPLAVVAGLLANLRTASIVPRAEPSLLDTLALDVRLQTDDDIVVDNNYGRFDLGADLRLIGTASAPALSGRAELREGGRLFVGRNIYTIAAGAIDFANPAFIEPNLNIEVTTRAGGEDIQVTLTGTPETLTPTLASTSDPDLGQADLAALLITGRRLDDLATADAALLGAQVLGNFSADVLGFAGRAVGLDTLRIGGVETAADADPELLVTQIDPTSRLTFGKSLGSNVDLTFSQSLRDGDAQTWIVDYLPSRQIEIRFTSDDDDLRSYGFRHDVSIGGGRRTAERVSRQPARPSVVAVRLAGTLLFDEERLRRELSLKVGDPFDYARWQDDRDRVVALYRAQGYLGARVGAARADEDGGVALTYTMQPGRKADVVVAGVNLPASVEAELRRAWSDAVFDSFLEDEAEAIVSAWLSREGFLQADIQTRVTTTENTTTLHVDVVPGARASSIVPRLANIAPALAAELLAALDREGLTGVALLERAAVERTIADQLRAMGYLRPQVNVAAPMLAGEAAVVAVEVTPGTMTTIGDVAFVGARSIAAALLLERTGLVAGHPASPSAIEGARGRIATTYRGEGFAGAVVAATQHGRLDGAVIDVTFDIDEGPRQVLSAVAVVGNRTIDTDVVERAVGLPVGQPLRPDDWLQARTRVFGTGLFRRVDVTAEPTSEADAAADVQPMRMQVTVEEWPALRARYGFRVNEERPEDNVNGRDLVPGLFADVTRRTLFGRAATVGAAVALQRRERTGRLFLNTPTMVGLPVRSSFIVERARREFASATLVTETTAAAWEQRARLGDFNFSYVYRFERNHTYDTKPLDPAFVFDVRLDVARLNGSGAFDTRDDPVNSTSGLLLSSSVEFASATLGSDIRYLRSLSQAYYFKPWRGVVFASAARAGLVKPLGDQELLSLFRFFAGGARTVRGVEENGVGPRDFFGDPAGGQALLVLNQEVRFPLFRWVGGVGFLDAGSIQRDATLSLRDLTSSMGAGVRLTTPFGVLRADYGRVLVAPGPERPGRFTFGIGQTF